MKHLARLPPLLALVALAAPAAPLPEPAPEIHGIWLDETAEAAISIGPCDSGICGELVWLLEPLDDGGQPKRDIHNSEPELQEQPLLGLRILSGFRPDGEGRWKDGRIYDPANGKSYKCKMELTAGGDVLKIRGYVLTSLFGRTTEWTRSELDSLPQAD